jgi:hypothetical protein
MDQVSLGASQLELLRLFSGLAPGTLESLQGVTDFNYWYLERWSESLPAFFNTLAFLTSAGRRCWPLVRLR